MKKVFFLMTFLCLALMAGAANEYRKVGNLWYLLSNDKKSATVVASMESENPYRETLEGEVIIPDSIKVDDIADTILVTEINNNVFEYCSKITSVTFKAKVKTIPQYCFHGCTGLTSFTFGEEVTTLETIGIHAFNGCTQLGSIIIPNSITTINGSAFFNCSGMTEVSIPESVKTINGNAFSGCSSLTKVNFASIEALLKIYFFDVYSNPLRNASAQLWINGEKLTSLVIPSGINTIGLGA